VGQRQSIASPFPGCSLTTMPTELFLLFFVCVCVCGHKSELKIADNELKCFVSVHYGAYCNERCAYVLT